MSPDSLRSVVRAVIAQGAGYTEAAFDALAQAIPTATAVFKRGDPSRDITTLRHVSFVMRAGIVYSGR